MHYVIGDIHGCYNELVQLLAKLDLTSEDVVYFVGDFVDRSKSAEDDMNLREFLLEALTED